MPTRPCVVLTREPEDNRALAAALGARRVPVRELACTRTLYLVPDRVPPRTPAVAFASRRAVRGFLDAGLAEHALGGATPPIVAAVGAATRRELERAGVAVDLVAEPETGHALADALDACLEPGLAVAVPCGSLAGGGLLPRLSRLGRPVVPVAVYANLAPPIEALAPFPVAAAFVAAPSSARRLLEALPWMVEVPILAIGPTTSAALESCGVRRVLGPTMDLTVQADILHREWNRHPANRADEPRS